jgi:uncharacterized membrane protein
VGIYRDPDRQTLDEQKLEDMIAHLLRAGVVAAALIVIGGAIPYLGSHAWGRPDYRTFHGEPDSLKSVQGTVKSAFSGDLRGIMQLGLLLLIATPIARVALSAVAFAVERDRMYVLFTLIVLTVLMYSLFGSFLIA